MAARSTRGDREARVGPASGVRDRLRQDWVEGTLCEGERVTGSACGWVESLTWVTLTLFLVEKRSIIMKRGAPRVAAGMSAVSSTGPVFAHRRRNASVPSFHSVAAA
eukprot:6488936-Amphidinium_carterae.1